jgi:hypothetical protein
VQGLPLNGEGTTVALYAAVLGCMGLLISWAAPACNNPLFAQIVPSHLRTMIFAFDRSFETAIAASAAPGKHRHTDPRDEVYDYSSECPSYAGLI